MVTPSPTPDPACANPTVPAALLAHAEDVARLLAGIQRHIGSRVIIKMRDCVTHVCKWPKIETLGDACPSLMRFAQSECTRIAGTYDKKHEEAYKKHVESVRGRHCPNGETLECVLSAVRELCPIDELSQAAAPNPGPIATRALTTPEVASSTGGENTSFWLTIVISLTVSLFVFGGLALCLWRHKRRRPERARSNQGIEMTEIGAAPERVAARRSAPAPEPSTPLSALCCWGEEEDSPIAEASTQDCEMQETQFGADVVPSPAPPVPAGHPLGARAKVPQTSRTEVQYRDRTKATDTELKQLMQERAEVHAPARRTVLEDAQASACNLREEDEEVPPHSSMCVGDCSFHSTHSQDGARAPNVAAPRRR